MIARATAVEAIPAIGHDEAMRLASVEYDRLLATADSLQEADWIRETECPGWTVKDMLGHVLGMLEQQGDGDERMRQFKIATADSARTGCLRLDAMTALQVREHAAFSAGQLLRLLHAAVPQALAARTRTTVDERAVLYSPGLPGEDAWTFGYLYDTILTRDPWIHRVDICRAVGVGVEASADHDGRIVADVVADWARRHGQPFTLTLVGPAGGQFEAGIDGPDVEIDAVAFCRILSGRAPGSGLLATRVPF